MAQALPQDDTKMGQDGPRWPKKTLGPLQDDPRRPQENENNNCPKKVPPDAPNPHWKRRTRMAPAWPQDVTKMGQDGPRWPKMAKDGTRMA